MTLEDLDRRLAAYHQAVDAMSTNLFELEGDSNRKLLAGATLTGMTALRWGAASGDLARLWQWFGQFKDLVLQADQLRGTRNRLAPEQQANLERLLCGPSVELSSEQVPLDQRPLAGAAQTTVRCSLDELLGRMSQAFEEVKAITVATGKAWDALLPMLQAATTELNRLTNVAGSLGETHLPELNQVRAELGRLTDTLATDPLSVDVAGAGALMSTLSIVAGDLDRLSHIREQLAAEIDRTRATLAEVNTAVDEARANYTETTAKIARPRVPPPPPLDPTLAGGPERIGALAASGHWRAVRDSLDRWTAAAGRQLQAASRASQACRAPLVARNELRGRLDAYRAKASAFGLLEDAAMSALYDQARAALYTAPTDLAAAVALVDRYRQSIPMTPPEREASS